MPASDSPKSAPQNEPRAPSRDPWLWLALLCVALLVRSGALAARFSSLADDPDAYVALAENLADHGTFGLTRDEGANRQLAPTAYRPPLYPFVLAPLVVDGRLSRVGVAILHGTVGMLTVAGTVWLGGRWGLGRRRFLAGLLVACDPLLLNQSTLVMTETLAAGLALTVLVAAQRLRETKAWSSAALLGGAIGLAALCRPTFLPLCAPLALITWFTTHGDGDWRGRVARVAALLVTVALVVSPWVIRNQRTFGRPIATTTHGGYTLILGNNPSFYEFLRTGAPGDTWDAQPVATMTAGCADDTSKSAHGDPLAAQPLASQIHDELAEDARLNACAWRHMRAEPAWALRAALYRVGQLWSPLAHRTSTQESLARRLARYATAAWYVGLFAAALVALAARRRELLRGPWLAGLTLCILFTLVHALYWSNLRMRAPLMPFVALVTAGAFYRKSLRLRA